MGASLLAGAATGGGVHADEPGPSDRHLATLALPALRA